MVSKYKRVTINFDEKDPKHRDVFNFLEKIGRHGLQTELFINLILANMDLTKDPNEQVFALREKMYAPQKLIIGASKEEKKNSEVIVVTTVKSEGKKSKLASLSELG